MNYRFFGPNSGVNDEIIRVGSRGNKNWGLIYFDLSDFKVKKVKSAKLWFYCVGNECKSATAMFLDVVTSYWDENIGWANRPTAIFYKNLSAAYAGEWIEVDVTKICQQWLADPASNFGL